MRQDLTYYELLDVPADASFADIRTAFREIQAIYDKDSLSTYSLFSPEERNKILNQAETAFSTLSDQKRRADYDQLLTSQGKLAKEQSYAQKAKGPEPVFTAPVPGQSGQAARQMRQKTKGPEFMALKETLAPGRAVTGADLKALRTAASVSLADIFEMSRVSVATLAAIEGEDRENLPRGIYLKGFLKSYAQCLDLPPDLIVSGYLSHLSEG